MERKAQQQRQKQKLKLTNEDEHVVDSLLKKLCAGVPLCRHQTSMHASRRTISKKDRVKLQAMCVNTKYCCTINYGYSVVQVL